MESFKLELTNSDYFVVVLIRISYHYTTLYATARSVKICANVPFPFVELRFD